MISFLQPYWDKVGAWLTIGLFVLALLLLDLLLGGIRARRRQALFLEQATRLLQHIHPTAGLVTNLNVVLDLFSSLADAQGYAFYLLDDNNDTYVLRAVRYQEELQETGKETYRPPISVKVERSSSRPEWIKEGEVPILQVPIGNRALVRIGPLSHLPRQTLDAIGHLATLLPSVIDTLEKTGDLLMQTDVVTTSDHALRTMAAMALDSKAILLKSLSMSAAALGINASLILQQQGRQFTVPVILGCPPGTQERLEREQEPLRQLWNGVGLRDRLLIRQGDPQFQKIMALLPGREPEFFLINKISLHGSSSLLISRVPSLAETGLSEDQLKASINGLATQVSQLVRVQDRLKPLSQTYVELLKLLSRTIDNLNPYTVGYSELMSRYSVIIARELGLPMREIQDISLAAYLSNVGVLGLSEDLYLKEGQFSEVEYEKMKLHAEVGAVLIEMTIGNKNVASYIRHHHERIDGHGYPDGLRGEEIPMGARIIAVVQTFLAKVNGRKYRAPLPFDQALALLQNAAGTQLDKAAVNALVQWFRTKQKGAARQNRSLGPCWEMCCSPSEICVTCPAFQQTEKNCWEFERNSCQAHGKQCETCFVYTEAMSRMAR
jgi:HD-GYP domain-containing protein (c-di-GMP phosphodiesterase class II)